MHTDRFALLTLTVAALCACSPTTASDEPADTVVSAVGQTSNDFYDNYVTGAGCATCSAGLVSSELKAVIAGGAGTSDIAYGNRDFGGTSGTASRVYLRSLFKFAPGTTLTANLVVLAGYDTANQVLYEVYLNAARNACLYAGPQIGGGGASCSSVVIANDGSYTRLETSALKGSSITLRVNGVDAITHTLSAGSGGNQRYLRAGVDHYDSSGTTDGKTVFHKYVNWSTAGWLGAPDLTAPSAPTSFVAANASAASIATTWAASTDNVGVVSYKLYRAGALAGTVTSGTAYSFTGLSCGTAYALGVEALDAAGNVSARTPLTVSTSACPVAALPAIPTGFTVTAGNASASLSWATNPSSDAVERYQVYKNDVLVADGPTGTTYVASGLINGAGCTFRVSAHNTVGYGNWTAAISVTPAGVAATTLPGAPTGLAGTAGNGNITLSWSANPAGDQVDGYQVYLNNALIADHLTATSYSQSGLSNGTSYAYRVSAHNISYGDWGNAVTLTPVGAGGTGGGGGGGGGGSPLETWEIEVAPNWLSNTDNPASGYNAMWVYATSPTTPFRAPDSSHQQSRYLLLDPRATDADGRVGNDDWWFIIEKNWPSSYDSVHHGSWGREVNFHNVAGDSGPGSGVGWGFGDGVSSLALDWLPGDSAPMFALEPMSPNHKHFLPVPTRDTFHTYVVHFVAGRTDGTTVHPGAITVWVDGNNTPAIALSNVNTVQRALAPDGQYYVQKWMVLWEGDYTQAIPVRARTQFVLTRIGRTLAEAIANRPTAPNTLLPTMYYSGSGLNTGAPIAHTISPRTTGQSLIPSSL